MKNTPNTYKKDPPLYWSMDIDDVRVVTEREALAAHRWGLRHGRKFSRDRRPHDGMYLITRIA